MPSLLSFLSQLLAKKKTNKSPLSNGETHEAVPRTQRVHPGLTLKPLGSVSRVPDDIWRQIAQFIPYAELKGLLGINASLFHLAMDARYRTVVLGRFNHAALQKLRRLRHVKPHTTSPAAARSPARREPRPVENHVTNFEGGCEGIIKEMVDTVCCFSGVVEFSISWRDPDRAPNEDEFLPFLTAAWNTFGSQLHKIELGVSLGQIWTLLCTTGRLDAVEELHFEIGCRPTTYEDVLATAFHS